LCKLRVRVWCPLLPLNLRPCSSRLGRDHFLVSPSVSVVDPALALLPGSFFTVQPGAAPSKETLVLPRHDVFPFGDHYGASLPASIRDLFATLFHPTRRIGGVARTAAGYPLSLFLASGSTSFPFTGAVECPRMTRIERLRHSFPSIPRPLPSAFVCLHITKGTSSQFSVFGPGIAGAGLPVYHSGRLIHSFSLFSIQAWSLLWTFLFLRLAEASCLMDD